MITINDIKVQKRKKDSTMIQSWETYWFRVGKLVSFRITKQDGIFKFFRKNCKSLKEAKQHIADMLNYGKSLYSI